MKIIILGGTGLIGYHASHALLAQGHKVSILSRGSINIEVNLPSEVNFIVADVFEMESKSLFELFFGFDAMVYAIGPDDREVPPYPSLVFFKSKLVQKCVQICESAKSAGVRKIVLLNSYLAYFDRNFPRWQLAKHHPYIACRVEQANECLALSNEAFKVIVLEIPYVFGTMPKRDPLWKEQLVSRLNILKPLMVFTSGGTAMTSVKFMGEAIRDSIEHGHTGSYIVGEQNMSWKEMLLIASTALKGFNKHIITIPTFIAQLYGYYEKMVNHFKGKQAGLDYPKYIKYVQSAYTYFPEELMQKTASELHITRGSVRQAMKETFIKCK